MMNKCICGSKEFKAHTFEAPDNRDCVRIHFFCWSCKNMYSKEIKYSEMLGKYDE